MNTFIASRSHAENILLVHSRLAKLFLAKFCVDISVSISIKVGYVASGLVERLDTSLTTSDKDIGCVDFVVSGFVSPAAITGCNAGLFHWVVASGAWCVINSAALWWTRC